MKHVPRVTTVSHANALNLDTRKVTRVPSITLHGTWLARAGFPEDATVLIDVQNNKITLTPDRD